MPGRATAINLTRQVTLATHVRVADTSRERGVGLLKDTGLAAGPRPLDRALQLDPQLRDEVHLRR